MDNCGICTKPASQLFETGKDGIYACFKCQPLVPEVTIEDNTVEVPAQTSSDQDGSDVGYYCSICHKSFQKNMQLQNHMRNHRAERRFVCTYCNKAFSQSNNLRAHLRIHTNERPFKCNECGKAFTQVTNLNNHVRLHTGERPFVCPELGCNKAYAQVTNLKNHTRIHTGERPFACPELGCNKAYAQVTNLNQHRKRHLNGRPVELTYDCTVCGEQFQQRNHMYTHRRDAHGDVKSPVRHKERVVQVKTEVQSDESEQCTYTCVFSSCGAQLSSPREHTEHLLRAHQLRVLCAAPAPRAAPARRGRPPKMLKDPLEIKEADYVKVHEVKILKQPQYLPKLKVQSLFQ